MSALTHVAVGVALSDAGEATRALALVRALRDRRPPGHDVRITFVSGGGTFEPMVEEAGFPVVACRPPLAGRSIAEDLRWRLPELVGSAELARDLIEGQRDALRALRPTVVLHGMWPFASLAARLLGLPTIAFLPLPLHPGVVAGGLLPDLPDPVPVLTRLPRPIRRGVARAAAPLMVRAPIFHQHRLGAGAAAAGWPGDGDLTFFDALRADLTLVTDLPRFHTRYRLPPGFALTGPIFPGGGAGAADPAGLDPGLAAALRRDGRPAVLVMMGSSGTPELLGEAARAFARPVGTTPDADVNVLILAPPAVGSVADVAAATATNPRVVVTDRFIPAYAAARLADVVVSHGGQGTVQTALAAGTPLVGVGLQMEQQINLDHVRESGAGIRIQRQRWHAPTIRRAVRTVLARPAYRHRAEALAAEIAATDGAATAADLIWGQILKPARA